MDGQSRKKSTEPPAKAAYPWPVVSHEPRIQQLSDDFARSGLKPFHIPVGVMLDEKNPQKSRCIRCNTCDGFACLVGAKSDSQVVCVDEAIKNTNVTLLTNSLVKQLEKGAAHGQLKSDIVEQRSGVRFETDVSIIC